MDEPLKLEVDPERLDLPGEGHNTGFFVRAEYEGKIGNYDIITLTRESLYAWLRSRGGENEWAESVVFSLLGHVSKNR